MSRVLGFIIFVIVFIFAVFSLAFAQIICPIFHEEVTSQQQETFNAILCDHNHGVHKDCMAHQVTSLATVGHLENEGFPCLWESQDGRKCSAKFWIGMVNKFLVIFQGVNLLERLEKEKSPSSKQEIKKSPEDMEIQNLVQEIESAFNLCCPLDGCGSTLDQIEGCNAATCSNTQCNQKFYYLCLKPQKNSEEAHQHDIKDVDGINLLPRHVGIIPAFPDDPRISRKFAQIKPKNQNEANIYQRGDLILSDVADEAMTHSQAIRYCKNQGARLPSPEEWQTSFCLFAAYFVQGRTKIWRIPLVH